MKRETKYLTCVMMTIAISVVFCFITIEEANEKPIKYELDTTTVTTVQEMVETTEELTTEELTTEELTTEELTTEKAFTKESTTEEDVERGQSDCIDYDVPSNNTMKTYMDYRTITSTNSKQYKLQKAAYTDSKGLRMVGDRYCIAVGSYYTTTIGQYIDVELENGKIIKCILADCKDDKHTDSTNRINPNGSVVEFVVDADVLDSTAKKMGDISHINGWNSRVVNIKVYDEVEEF